MIYCDYLIETLILSVKEALATSYQHPHAASDELNSLIQISQFLIKLRLAIIANKWFDDSGDKNMY
jgi:hypothetical protein